MPLIVIGADTRKGQEILDRLEPAEREVRVFVTDESTGLELRERGFKVATGDVSDESHVEAAALRCFSAVLIKEAATDGRERAFASGPRDVLEGWARAMNSSDVTRVIWVTDGEYPETRAREVTSVDPSDPGFAERVVALDEAHSIR
jgi:putative NADH-flavin reductase